MQLCPKIQDIVGKMPLYVFFFSYLYHAISNITGAVRAVSHECCLYPNITSLNVILYNSSANNKLILRYILNTIWVEWGKKLPLRIVQFVFCEKKVVFRNVIIVLVTMTSIINQV